MGRKPKEPKHNYSPPPLQEDENTKITIYPEDRKLFTNPKDIFLLRAIYDFRVLTLEQAYDMFYNPLVLNRQWTTQDEIDQANNRRPVSTSPTNIATSWYKLRAYKHMMKRLKFLESQGLIKRIEPILTAFSYLEITNKGINLLAKYFLWSKDIYNPETGIVHSGEGYETAAQIRIKPSQAPHQVMTTQLFTELFKRGYDPKWKDGRYIKLEKGNRFSPRPDASFTIPGKDDIIFMVETDMNREVMSQLRTKFSRWSNYSYVAENLGKKLVILFTLNDNKPNFKPHIRIKTVQTSAWRELRYNRNIELIAGTIEEVATILENSYLKSERDIYIASAIKLFKKNGLKVEIGTNHAPKSIAPDLIVTTENGSHLFYTLVGNDFTTSRKLEDYRATMEDLESKGFKAGKVILFIDNPASIKPLLNRIERFDHRLARYMNINSVKVNNIFPHFIFRQGDNDTFVYLTPGEL